MRIHANQNRVGPENSFWSYESVGLPSQAGRSLDPKYESPDYILKMAEADFKVTRRLIYCPAFPGPQSEFKLIFWTGQMLCM